MRGVVAAQNMKRPSRAGTRDGQTTRKEKAFEMHAQDNATPGRTSYKTDRGARGEGGCYEEWRKGKFIGWVATIPIPGDRPKTFRAKTQKEALAKRKAFEERLARGEVVLGKRPSKTLDLDIVRTVTVQEHIDF